MNVLRKQKSDVKSGASEKLKKYKKELSGKMNKVDALELKVKELTIKLRSKDKALNESTRVKILIIFSLNSSMSKKIFSCVCNLFNK